MMAPAPSSASVVGIVLCAGLSRRMGAFKPLLSVDGGRVLVQAVVDQVGASLEQVLVVVGHRGDEVRACLAGRQVQVVENSRYAEGMLSSAQCGVAAAGVEAAGFLFCLGDQPHIPAGLIAAILTTARSSGRGIVLPTWEGHGGHPVFVASRYRRQIATLTASDGGLRSVTRGHPEDTAEIAVDTAAVVEDLDTPEQYRRWRGGR